MTVHDLLETARSIEMNIRSPELEFVRTFAHSVAELLLAPEPKWYDWKTTVILRMVEPLEMRRLGVSLLRKADELESVE